MSLAGKGAVAIWHDIAPEGRAEFYRWHGLEHMPERAGIPGFLRGRRYVAIDEAPEYFNLYETESPFTVTGAGLPCSPQRSNPVDGGDSQTLQECGALAMPRRGQLRRRTGRVDRDISICDR